MMRRSRDQLIIASIAFTVLLLVFGVAGGASRTAPAPLCMDAETREIIRKISLEGFDAALKEHMAHLFDIWMKDETDQPKRAQTGARAGFSAYARARHAALIWNPPLCP
jgi:hypothetical protein